MNDQTNRGLIKVFISHAFYDTLENMRDGEPTNGLIRVKYLYRRNWTVASIRAKFQSDVLGCFDADLEEIRMIKEGHQRPQDLVNNCDENDRLLTVADLAAMNNRAWRSFDDFNLFLWFNYIRRNSII